MTILVAEESQSSVYQSTRSEAAVCVHNAHKSYGLGKNRSTILRSLDMTVQKGTM